jgi:AmiR/NasT family two-component response regulator
VVGEHVRVVVAEAEVPELVENVVALGHASIVERRIEPSFLTKPLRLALEVFTDRRDLPLRTH